jgi:hypothetical protein
MGGCKLNARIIKLACTTVVIVVLALAVTSVSADSFVFTGTIASGPQYDLFSIPIPAGMTVTATLVCDEIAPGDRPLDPVLSVYFPGSDPSDTINADVYNDDGFGTDDDPNGVDCNAFDSSRVIFTTPTTATYIFRADGFGSSTGPYTLTINTSPVPPPPTVVPPAPPPSAAGPAFDPGDDRVNPEAHAPVAIYCTSNNSVEVWAVVSAERGELAFTASAASISAAAAGSEITSGWGASLHKLPDGRLQVNATQRDGKGYVFIWNGCPAANGESYVIENGVAWLTGTFTYK